ncbi:unnamed protein product [Closterium sp. Yama58-4]|nr:unnamed protein product [Closterium sp. Yama58-4]
MGFIDGISGNLNNISMPSVGSDVDPFKVAAGLAVAVGVAAIGGVAAAVTVGGIIVLREQGQFMLPWEDKPKAVRPAPLTVQQWRDCFDDATGRLKGGGETAIGRVRLGGCDAEIRAEVWPFLLGLYEAESTEAERAQLRAQRRVLYEEIRAIAARVAVIARQAEEEATRRMKEEEEREEREEREREERERKEREEREREEREREERGEREGEESERGRSNEGGSSQGEVRSSDRGDNGGAGDGSESGNGDGNGSNGGENSGVGNASDDEFSDAVCVDSACASLSVSTESFVDRIMRLDAVRMNAAWIPYSTQKAFPPEEAMEAAAAAGLPEHGHLSPPQRLHAARLVAILEAYAVYDPEVGYCQGMSDLLSPFVALLEEDSEAFWCFVAFMQRGEAGEDCEWEKVEAEEAEDKGRGEGERKGAEGEEGEREGWERDDESAPLLDNGWGGAFGWAAGDKSSVRSDVTTTTTAAAASATSSSSSSSISARNKSAGNVTSRDTSRDMSRDASRVSGSRRKKAWQECRPRPDFLLFVVAAILVSRREQVLCCQGLDGVLLLCNSLSGQLDVWELMHCARQLAARLP